MEFAEIALACAAIPAALFVRNLSAYRTAPRGGDAVNWTLAAG